jgi:cell wall-associated NlpC family hydrolase
MSAMKGSRAKRRAGLAALVALCLLHAPVARAGDAGEVAAEIVVQAMALLGVPYRWGGNDPERGLDCSGLVRHVFKSVGIGGELPRRSQEMRVLGKTVARAELRAGDLVFFNTLGAAFSHVAIYIGDGRFVHSPGKHGQVRVDDLDDRYWRARFNGARRLAPAPVVVAESRVPPQKLWRLEDFPEGP